MTAPRRVEGGWHANGRPWPDLLHHLPPGTSLRERLWYRSVETANGCWIWQGRIGWDGYGAITIEGKPIGVHRASFEAFVGPIPDGLQIDHLCRTRACWRPDHLEAVTPHENWLRSTAPTAANARKTHCKHGHEFTTENIYWIPSGAGRACRTCRTDAAKRRTHRARQRRFS